MTTIPQNDAGLASSQTESFDTIVLFTGDTPVTTTPEIVATATIAAADLPANSVVGRNSSGELVLATLGDSEAEPAIPAIEPIGITVNTVKEAATSKNVAVYRSGMFNPEALNWDATYDTDEKKRVAFEGSQPTIFIRGVQK